MDTTVIKKLLKNEMINEVEFNTFIVDYVKATLNKEISQEELYGITALVQNGIFNLKYAVESAARILNISVTRVLDKDGKLLRVDIV